MGLPIVEAQHEPQPAQHQMPGTMPHEQEKQLIAANLANVKRRIGIHSGKGGVGKTFLSVNIAYTLAAAGKKVGLLDADIDCPNVARTLNLREIALGGTKEGRIMPLEVDDVKIVSTHFLTDTPAQPMIVRGPIKHKVLTELLANVEWGELDALIVDLPPGTSDVPLSSMLVANLDGMIIVTTPQKEAIMDARKSALMAQEMGIPVLGIVENMTGEAFGSGTGAALARELGVPLLCSIPLTKDIRMASENGKAALLEAPYRAQADALVRGVLGETAEIKKRSFWKRIALEW